MEKFKKEAREGSLSTAEISALVSRIGGGTVVACERR